MRTLTFIPQPRVDSSGSYAVPPLVAYEDWYRGLPLISLAQGGLTVDAAKHRRIAMLRKAGDNWCEIGRCVRLGPNAVRAAWDRLPEALR